MPELPEVETIARTLAPQVTGRVITAVKVLLPKTLAAGKTLFTSLFPGASILSVRRRAKLLLVDLAAPGAGRAPHILAFHLKMTGKLFVHAPVAEPFAHTRMVFDLAEPGGSPASRLFFDDMRTFGYCRLMRPEDLAVWPFWNKLGPEPLTLSPEGFAQTLSARNGKIKSLLLNQSVIAGIGNIYADEACFRSGINPAAPAATLGKHRLVLLLENLKAVLLESIAECGSSIRDYRDANGNAGAFQNKFQVYGRGGQPCILCGQALEKTVVAGRTTIFCPHCQKK